MKKLQEYVTDEQVEEEIVALRNDEYVQLAKAEERMRYKRRQYLYKLRNYRKKGIELSKCGFSIEDFSREIE